MAGRRIEFTRKDYEQLPEDWLAQLVEGDLVMTPSPDPSHESLVSELMFALRAHLGEGARGRILGSRVDIHIDDRSVLVPDVVVLPEGTRPTPRPWKIPTPVCVMEVLSPGSAARDRGVKLRLYARAGIREAWIVDPDTETIEVHDLAARVRTAYRKGERAASRAVPGFGVDVAELFSF